MLEWEFEPKFLQSQGFSYYFTVIFSMKFWFWHLAPPSVTVGAQVGALVTFSQNTGHASFVLESS